MIAKARFIRMSPRKVRLVADLIRGLPVAEAETQLQFMRKAATTPLAKLLHSAIANAEDHYEASREHLTVGSIMIDAAPMLKRWKPRAFGRATPIRKRGSHITIMLQSSKPLKERAKTGAPLAVVSQKDSTHAHGGHGHEQVAEGKAADAHQADVQDPRRVGSRHEPSHTKPVQKKSKGFLRKLFSRKTG